MNNHIIIKPPYGQRQGQALYNFLYWLQENYQQDTFYLSDHELNEAFGKWIESLNMCQKCGKPLHLSKGKLVCQECI